MLIWDAHRKGCLPVVQEAGTDHDFNGFAVSRCGVTRQLHASYTKGDLTFSFFTKLPNVLGRSKHQHLVPKPHHLAPQFNSLSPYWRASTDALSKTLHPYFAVRGRKEWLCVCAHVRVILFQDKMCCCGCDDSVYLPWGMQDKCKAPCSGSPSLKPSGFGLRPSASEMSPSCL